MSFLLMERKWMLWANNSAICAELHWRLYILKYILKFKNPIPLKAVLSLLLKRCKTSHTCSHVVIVLSCCHGQFIWIYMPSGLINQIVSILTLMQRLEMVNHLQIPSRDSLNTWLIWESVSFLNKWMLYLSRMHNDSIVN